MTELEVKTCFHFPFSFNYCTYTVCAFCISNRVQNSLFSRDSLSVTLQSWLFWQKVVKAPLFQSFRLAAFSSSRLYPRKNTDTANSVMNSDTDQPARLPEASGTVLRKSFQFVSSWASSVPRCHLWLPSSPSLQLHQILLLDKHFLHPPPTPLFSPVTPTSHFPSFMHFHWPPTTFLSSHKKAYFSSLHVRLYFINTLLPTLSQSQTKLHLVLNSALLAKHTFPFTNTLYQDITMIWNNLPRKFPFSLRTNLFKSHLTWIKSTRF